MFRFSLVMLISIASVVEVASAESAGSLNRMCRDLLTCTIKRGCVQMDWLGARFENATINEQLYNDLDQSIDYGCVFSAGCEKECNSCPLCLSAKTQLVDVLSGSRRDDGGDCSVLVNCASECVEHSAANITAINRCLRYDCAFHCFDGSCPKCAAFTTRIFNQICATGNLRTKVPSFDGQCYQLFRAIVFAKFESQFTRAGLTPSIGPKNAAILH